MAYLDFTKGGLTMGYNPPLKGEFGDVLGRPNLNNILGDGGYQEMLRRTSPAPRTGPVPETQIDRMVKALTGTNPSKQAKAILVKKPGTLAKAFPTLTKAGKTTVGLARGAVGRFGPQAMAFSTGLEIGDLANKALGRPTIGDALQSWGYRNPNINNPTLKKLSKEEVARLPENIKQELMNSGLGYVLGLEDEEVASVTNQIKNQGKQNINQQPVPSNQRVIGTAPTVLRDANGNAILPGLPSTSIIGDLPDISTAPGNMVSDLSENGIENIDIKSEINTSSDLDKLLELYNKRLSLNEPYVQSLENYVNSYPELQRQAYLRDVQRAGINDYIHGTNTASQLLGKYTPAEIEATRLDLLNKLLQIKAGELTGADELVGRASLAQSAGLPLEAALADKDTFKAMSPIMSSINALKGRTYAADINNQTKLQVAKMKLESDMAIAKANRDVRAQIAIGNQLATINRALITSMGFNGISPAGLADVYNQMGYGTLDTSNLQGVDLQSAMNNLGL